MPRYAFEARGATGELVRGTEHAANEIALDRLLQQNQLFLIDATLQRKRRRRGSTSRALIDFTYHLAAVIEAGIPIIEGLRDLADSDHPLQDEIADVAHRVELGSLLSEALAEHPRYFPDLMVSLVKAGEASGSLDRILRDLVVYLEWREDLRRQISSASTYPMIVIVGIGGLLMLLSVFVLPRFLKVFADLGASLPPTTRAIVGLHGFMAAYWLPMGLGALALVVGFGFALQREPVRLRLDALILRVPMLGTLVLMIEMSRFAHNLSLMQGTGTPILASLRMIESVVQNRVVRNALARGRERIEQGATLTDGLGRSDLMPSLVVRMISVGETSGRLEESLERVSSYYDREVPMKVNRALAIFNLCIMLLLGTVLVTIALSIFGPLYEVMGDLSAT